MLKKRQGAPAPVVAVSPIVGTSEVTGEPVNQPSTSYQFVSAGTTSYPSMGTPQGEYNASVATGTQPSATHFEYPCYPGPCYPGVPMEVIPSFPCPPFVYTYTTPPQYWGVQEKLNEEKGEPKYWVVNPDTLVSLPTTVTKIVARCDTENDARMICKLLNEQYEGTQEPAKGKRNPCDCKPSEYCDCCALVKQDKQEPRRLTATLAKEYIQNLQGRALTIIDAAIAGEAQNKALKDLFKREFRKSIGKVYEFAYQGMDGESGSDIGEDSLD
jgi:hypothetical protein